MRKFLVIISIFFVVFIAVCPIKAETNIKSNFASNNISQDTDKSYTQFKEESSQEKSFKLYTQLQEASSQGNLEKVQALIKQGANVNMLVVDKNKKIYGDPTYYAYYEKTPLMLASEKGYLAIVKELLTAGANVNQILPVYTNRPMSYHENFTALTMACQSDNIEILKILAKAGTNMQAILFCACDIGNEYLLNIALQNNPNLNFAFKEDCNMSPIKLASYHGYKNIVKALIKAGADVNYVNKQCDDGNIPTTVLIEATSEGHLEVVKLLLQAGADVNASDVEGSTALIVASRKGYLEIVKVLIKAGANIEAKDLIEEETALQAAQNNDHTEIVQFLKVAGAKE